MSVVVRTLVAVFAVLVASLGSLVLVASTAGAAPCETCPGDPTTYDWQSTLTVSKSGGPATITSTPAGIDCGPVCSVVDERTTSTALRPTTGWPSYTLSAGSMPSGYVPMWTGCDSVTSGTCSVVNDSASGSVSVAIVDITAPTVTFDPPAKVGAAGMLSAGGTDNSGFAPTFKWTVDSMSQSSTASSISISNLADGQHTVSVLTQDASGNQSAPVSRTVTLDKSTSVEVGDTPAVTNQDFTWSFTPAGDVPADGTHRACDLDGLGWAQCSTTTSMAVATGPLAEGGHILSLRVTDDVANTVTVQRHFVVDRTAPVIQITGGPSEGGSVTTALVDIPFSVTDPHPGSIACRLDAGTVPCSATQAELSNLTAGQHTFTVTGTDAAGNTASASRHFSKPVVRTATTLGAHPVSARVRKGHRVTLVGKLAPTAATGTVTFKQGTRTLCRGTVVRGVAQCRTSARLAKGLHRVRATYSGAPLYLASTATTSFRIV